MFENTVFHGGTDSKQSPAWNICSVTSNQGLISMFQKLFSSLHDFSWAKSGGTCSLPLDTVWAPTTYLPTASPQKCQPCCNALLLYSTMDSGIHHYWEFFPQNRRIRNSPLTSHTFMKKWNKFKLKEATKIHYDMDSSYTTYNVCAIKDVQDDRPTTSKSVRHFKMMMQCMLWIPQI